tara:strand:- start:384 stop:521 length:138 start_codon:yes stop_codon:yes gene_type:complete
MNAILGLFTIVGDIIKRRPVDTALILLMAIVFWVMKNDGTIKAMW